MEERKRYRIPAFGDWDYCDELPITQYFESAAQAGLLQRRDCFQQDRDLFRVVPVYKHHHHHNPKKQMKLKEQQQMKKQSRVLDIKRHKAPKAVDEDLYKIPPELFYQKPKQGRATRSLWSACLKLSCIS